MTGEEAMQSMENALIQIKEELAAQKEQIKGALRRIDEQAKLTESVHELAMSVKLIANDQKSTNQKIDDIAEDVEELKQRPMKRMDDVTKVVISVIVTAIVTFALTQIGLK